jgi:hypothetical protein
MRSVSEEIQKDSVIDDGAKQKIPSSGDQHILLPTKRPNKFVIGKDDTTKELQLIPSLLT